MSQSKEGYPSSESALQNVFGSRVSLAELSGDISSRNSRTGSPAPPESWTAHRRTRAKSKSISMPRSAAARYHHAPLGYGHILMRAVVLFVQGVIYGWVHAQLVPTVVRRMPVADLDWQLLCISGLWAVILGISLPLTDRALPPSTARAKAIARSDWLPIVRALGAFLGMTYAVSKLDIATVFWCIASPFLWLVLDGSRNGLVCAVAAAVLGPLSLVFLGSVSSDVVNGTEGWHMVLWMAASYFSSSIFFGNLGRRLFPAPLAGP